MTEEQQKLVLELLETLRVNLQNDGGDLEFIRFEGYKVILKLVGACGTCPFATMTLKGGIERILQEQVCQDIIVERLED